MGLNETDTGKANGLGGRVVPLLRVHFDAVRLAPRPWLMALWWRILGKRVRSRAQFAPLLGASPHAYRLWLMDEPPHALRAEDPCQIVALVAAGQGQDNTLNSAAEQGITALVVTPETASHIATQIDWQQAPWIMPLAAGDVLAPGAGDTYRSYAMTADDDVRAIYSDDDLLGRKGERTAPHFKPSWNAELFRHFDYLTGACIVRASVTDLAALSSEGWATRLVGFAIAAGQAAPLRIPHVLHHRRSRSAPLVLKHPEAWENGLPKVTVIIPTRNRVDLLRTCIEGLGRTDYPDFEVIVVDNGSDDPATLNYLAGLDPARVRVLRDDGPFNFSRLNNRAAKLANGEMLCLLNNDIEILSPDWLTTMVHQALRPEVGAVGARLLYPDGRIQHAGVVMGICGGAAHAHRLLRPEEEGYFRRHALPQFIAAVTAACLVVRRESFEAVGGLDEDNFAVAFNDVDLCMRLNERGWQSLYEPRATLVHHESVSRGLDRDPVGAARFAKELEALKIRWGTGDMEGDGDPFHHPQLSRFSERFALRL
jgi:GT2 family glycosyltransferase